MSGGRLICVAPAPAIDRLEEVEALRAGAIHRPVAVTALPGGKGLNVARAAHRLGAPVTAVGFLAGHAGRWVEDALSGIGVSGRFTWVDGETRTCVSILDRATAELTEIYEPSPAVGAGDWDALLALLDETMASHAAATGDGTIVTISGGLPTGSPDDAFARVVATAHAWGARTLVDAYGPGLAAALVKHPWLVKVNATEAAEALGADSVGGPGAGIRDLAQALVERGAGNAVVTAGSSGSVLVGTGLELRLGPPPVRGRYPVGSGDAFLAGMAAGLAAGLGLGPAFFAGAGAAAANALVPGAGELDPDEARRLATRIALTSAGSS